MYNKVDISGINTSSLTVLSGEEKQKLLEWLKENFSEDYICKE